MCLSILLFGCAVNKEDRIASKADMLNKFSPPVLVAMRGGKFGDDFLRLRKNKTFVYRSGFFGATTDYCYGTYSFEGKTLKLIFADGYKSHGIDAAFVVTAKNGEPVLQGATSYFDILLDEPNIPDNLRVLIRG